MTDLQMFSVILSMKLDNEKSKVYRQIENIQKYAKQNDMKLNVDKCKFLVFNPTKNYDFIPDLNIEGNQIATAEEMKLLGLTIRSDLKWKSNTDTMVTKGYKRLWMIKRLKSHGASIDDLKEIYIKQIRSVLEFGVPVWNNGLSKAEVVEIERIQKAFLHIALGTEYHSYKEALETAKLETLEHRRLKLCTTFAKKFAKHPKHRSWFKPENSATRTRNAKPKFKVPLFRLTRFRESPIPYLTNLLNK